MSNLPTIDVAQIREFNKERKSYTDKAISAKAEYDFNASELQKLCAEL